MNLLSVGVGPFSIQVSHLQALAALLVAGGVGHLMGRRQHMGIGHVLSIMVWVGLLAARVGFVATWWDLYREDLPSIANLRDGGFTLWPGLAAAGLVAIWHGWRGAALRRPLMAGLTAGAITWAALSGWLDNPNRPTLPTVVLTTRAGESLDLATIANGQPLVVNLWASWCPPCRREMPVLAAAQQREPGVIFVFANQAEDAGTALRYLSTHAFQLAHVVFDPRAELGRAVGSTGLPTTLFYDASGQLVSTHLGELSPASLASQLMQLRAAAKPASQAHP